jgi:hypothetical protein
MARLSTRATRRHRARTTATKRHSARTTATKRHSARTTATTTLSYSTAVPVEVDQLTDTLAVSIGHEAQVLEYERKEGEQGGLVAALLKVDPVVLWRLSEGVYG